MGVGSTASCSRYVKDTKMKANHNYRGRMRKSSEAVPDMSKILK